MRLLCLLVFPLSISSAIEFKNKSGAVFSGDLIAVLDGNGNKSAKIRRKSDGRLFMVPLRTLSEETLIAVIEHQAKLIENNHKQPPQPVAPLRNVQPPAKAKTLGKIGGGDKIIDFRIKPDRWDGKTVTVTGVFDYKSSVSQSFSMEQGDAEIDVIYSGLSKREVESILKQNNFSKNLVRVSGRLEKKSFADNDFNIIAKKVEFLDF